MASEPAWVLYWFGPPWPWRLECRKALFCSLPKLKWTKHLRNHTRVLHDMHSFWIDDVNCWNLNSYTNKSTSSFPWPLCALTMGYVFPRVLSYTASVISIPILLVIIIIDIDQELTHTIVNLLLLSLIVIQHQSLDFFLLLLFGHLSVPDVSCQSRAERNLEIC